MPCVSTLVINTGPLLALFAATGNLGPLRRVAGRVIVPYEVECEILAGGKSGFAVDLYLREAWLERRTTPTVLLPYLANAVDRGEASVIAVALNESVSQVCLDDQEARHVARLSGLEVTGSIGVLIAAKRLGEPVSMREAVENMRRRGIWLSERLAAQAIVAAGE